VAKALGVEVKDRGRVSAELVVKFKAATGQYGAQCAALASETPFYSHACEGSCLERTAVWTS
jgi:hypothetical protein